jgi:hypothetical protein
VEAVNQSRLKAESQVMELRNKVSSLQADLDNRYLPGYRLWILCIIVILDLWRIRSL